MGIGEDQADLIDQSALLRGLALDLRLPLLQIKNKLENIQLEATYSTKDLNSLSLSTESGLRLLEAFSLSTSSNRQDQLQLEPVAISALLDDAAHALSGYAKQYSTNLEVSSSPGLKPVLAHKKTALLALTILGESLVRTQLPNSRKNNTLVFGAHRYQSQIIAGVFGNFEGLSSKSLQLARRLCGTAQQPISSLAAHSGGGILIADQLCAAFSRPLQFSQHEKQQGFATIFQISNQLQLL